MDDTTAFAQATTATDNKATTDDTEPTPTSPQQESQHVSLASPTAMPTPRRRFAWTEPMIETLLSLRLRVLAESFAGSRSVAQIASAWERLRLRFALLHGAAAETQQLKNKYQALKKEYTSTTNAMNATGNRTDNPIALPTYWAVLTQYLRDKRGMGSVDFAQSTHTDAAVKRKAEVDAEIADQREQRRKNQKVDVGKGLVLLGETLAKALSSGQPVLSTTTMGSLAKQQSAIMDAIESNQRQLMAHLESANAVNAAILAFLNKSV